MKQETTLEEVAERLYPVKLMYFPMKVVDLNEEPRNIFIQGAKWEQERSYSETIELIQFLSMNEDFNGYGSVSKETAQYFLKQFKKK